MPDLTPQKSYEPWAAPRLRARWSALDGITSVPGKRLWFVLALWAAVALVYWPSAVKLHSIWTNWGGETYTHGYLIFLMAVWLVIRDRKRLAGIAARPEPLALIPLFLLSAAWVWFWRAAIQELQLLLLPLILFVALYSTLGRRSARALAFPVGFLYFALPFWDDFVGIVQGLSAKVTGLLILVAGLPAYVSGKFIHLPGGTIEIARSCSGLHELIVGLALAALYGKLSDEPWRRRLLWLGIMGALSLIVNWVRIFIVVMAAYETDMRSSLVKNHYWLGWWLFALVFAGFLWWTGRRPAQGASQGADLPDSEPRLLSAPQAFAAVATLAALTALPALSYAMDWTTAATPARVQIDWPRPPRGWDGPSAPVKGHWHPMFHAASGESLTRYTDPAGQPVAAFVVAYRVQTQKSKLLGYSNHLLGSPERMRQQFARKLNAAGGPWREIVVVNDLHIRSLIWTRYRIGHRVFADPRASQLWYGLVAVVRPPMSSETALRTACIPDCTAARARLSAAVPWLHPSLR